MKAGEIYSLDQIFEMEEERKKKEEESESDEARENATKRVHFMMNCLIM
jgi:hypothetical protein